MFKDGVEKANGYRNLKQYTLQRQGWNERNTKRDGNDTSIKSFIISNTKKCY